MDDFQLQMPLEEDTKDILPIIRDNFKDNSGTRTDRHTTTDLQDMHGPCHQQDRHKCHTDKEIRINSRAVDASEEDHKSMRTIIQDSNSPAIIATKDKDTHMDNSDYLQGGLTRIRNRARISLQYKK